MHDIRPGHLPVTTSNLSPSCGVLITVYYDGILIFFLSNDEVQPKTVPSLLLDIYFFKKKLNKMNGQN